MSFEVFEQGYEGDMSRKEAIEFVRPIKVENDPTAYSDVAKLIDGEVRKIISGSDDEKLNENLQSLANAYQICNLMEGTTNLINTVVEKSECGTPVRTVLFLDKSARNGAYLFTTLWDTLSQTGEITNTEKPDIRFMDIGRENLEKHGSRAPLALLRDRFSKTNFPKNGVLIVDEYVFSGGTLRRALKTLKDQFGAESTAVAQFATLPPWYDCDSLGITGITDIGFDYPTYRVFSTLKEIPSDLALDLKDVVDKHRGNFQSLYKEVYSLSYGDQTRMEDWSVEYFTKRGIENITIKDFEIVAKILLKCKSLEIGDGDTVVEFINSAGGFLGRPLRKYSQKENNIRYRHLLKFMVKAYVARKNSYPIPIQE